MKRTLIPLSCILMISATLFTKCAAHKLTANTGSQQSETTRSGKPGTTTITDDAEPSMSADALQGTWEFDYFTMINTDKKILFPKQFPELTFDTKSKKFSGSAGCNNISGTFTQNGGQLNFKQPMIMTRMSCNATGEKTFVDYLISVRKFNIKGNSLELISDLKPIVILRKAGK